MTEHINAPYKYTIPISKAFVGDDGKRRLVGAATGPEVDLEDQRVSKSLIDKWVSQINNGQIEVVYDDWHKKEEQSLTAELGIVEKAWTDDKGYMWVQVVLDEDNPVSQYIHKAAARGKQYGMSIFGKATAYADEIVANRRVRTIIDGTLERIAHTTRPIWTPSFGTVLSKAVDTAVAESAKGDTSVSEVEKTDAPQEEVPNTDTDDAAKTESGAATAADTGTAPEAEEAEGEATVEKAIKADTKRDEKRLEKIVKLYSDLGSELREAGFLAEETAAEGSEETTVQKAATTEDTPTNEVVELRKSVSELTALVTALADRIPDGSAPGLLQKAEPVDPLAELKAVDDPMERLRLAFAAKGGEGLR
jgi:hypothetical protein